MLFFISAKIRKNPYSSKFFLVLLSLILLILIFFVLLPLEKLISMKKILRSVLFLCAALMVCGGAWAQSNKWRDVYKAKKKDTLFGIANKYDISLPELLEANPEMKKEGYTLQHNDFVFIPYTKNHPSPQGTWQVNPPASTAAGNGVPSAPQRRKQSSTLRVGVMLPLHDVNGDGRRMTEYYRGILMACDDLKRSGYSIDVRAWNVPVDADIRKTLIEQGANDRDIIFGPLYTNQVAPLADFCKAYDTKLVIPFSISGDDVERNNHIYQVYQSPEVLNDKAINVFLERFTNVHPVFIDCNDTTSRKGNFTFGLRKKLEARGIKYSITNVKSNVAVLAKAFDRTKQNVVILNTGRSPQLNEVLAKLDALTSTYPGLVISLYGYNEWLMYAPYDLDKFFKYDTYVPSNYYVNESSAKTIDLQREYKRYFGKDMMYALPRFALTGYDQAMFFLEGLKQKGQSFDGLRGQSSYQPVQTPLKFVKTKKGGFRNDNFQLIHYTYNRNIESIAY